MSLRPNFFVIGAQKSGTTTVCSLLGKHPDIFMTTPKEPAFFCEELNWAKGFGWYEGLFQNAERCAIRAEGSTFYTQRPEHDKVVERISDYSPDARFLYVVRDPFERLVSHYWHLVRHHFEGKDMLNAVKSNPQYLLNGHYAYQLAPYVSSFGMERIMVLSYEEFFANKVEALNMICTWLGLEGFSSESIPAEHLNKGATEMEQVRGNGLLFRFSRSLFWRSISRFVPSSLSNLGRRLASKPIHRDEQQLEAVIEHCLPLMKPQVREFELMIGREFPEWKNFR